MANEREIKTREGVEVRRGQLWQDLDKRMSGRVVKVIDVWPGRGHFAGEWFATVRPVALHHPDKTYQRTSNVRISRMYKHSTGFKLIKDVPHA